MSEPKQIIVIRKDLNMRKGKMVAQGAHASMAVLLAEQNKMHHPSPAMAQWLSGHFTKICVSVNSEEELLNIYKQAVDAGIPASLIKDSGFTEFKEPTFTAVGVGPDFPEKLDPITGKLPLL